VGGVLVDVAGWRWVFLVNVPFVLLAAPLGLPGCPSHAERVCPRSTSPAWGSPPSR
jgi:MFS family permease